MSLPSAVVVQAQAATTRTAITAQHAQQYAMRLLKFALLAATTDALRTNRRAVLRQASAGTLMVNLPFQLPSIGRAAGPATNEVVGTVNGIRRKRLGGSDIVVSEVGLGTQRWGGADFNSPDKELCHKLLDRGVLEGGTVSYTHLTLPTKA